MCWLISSDMINISLITRDQSLMSTPISSIPANVGKQRIMLKNMIDNNEHPEIVDAFAVAGKFALGDVEHLGYGKFHRVLPGGQDYEVWFFTYTGPNAIVVNGKTLRWGDSTEHTIIDYT